MHAYDCKVLLCACNGGCACDSAPDVRHVRTSEFHNVEGTNCRFRSLFL